MYLSVNASGDERQAIGDVSAEPFQATERGGDWALPKGSLIFPYHRSVFNVKSDRTKKLTRRH